MGGFGFGSTTVGAKIGWVAMIAQHAVNAKTHLAWMFPDLEAHEINDAFDFREAHQALQDLEHQYGIKLNAEGDLVLESEPRLNLDNLSSAVKGITGTVAKEIFRQQREAQLDWNKTIEEEARGRARRHRRSDQ